MAKAGYPAIACAYRQSHREMPPRMAAMEAYSIAHDLARELARLGHEVRRIPPIYGKSCMKRYNIDALDAEANYEALQLSELEH